MHRDIKCHKTAKKLIIVLKILQVDNRSFGTRRLKLGVEIQYATLQISLADGRKNKRKWSQGNTTLSLTFFSILQ